MELFNNHQFHLVHHRNVFLLLITNCSWIHFGFYVVHTLPRQHNQTNITNNNASVSTQDMLHANGQSTMSSTAALINAFIDSDDEPLYDKVASDEDYSSLPPNEQQKRAKMHKKAKKVTLKFEL